VTAILQVNGLTKWFGGLMAVSDVTFAVESGEVFGIIGPNGAGKTTLLNLISNRYPPSAGSVVYNNNNIVGSAPNQIAKMGLIRTYQSTVSYESVTVWENLIRAQLGYNFLGFWQEFLMTKSVQQNNKVRSEKAENLLNFFGLVPWKDYPAKSLPYGYQKLLGLAIGLAGNPRILMLDEPAAGLTLEERAHLVAAINKINANGVTVIMVEHDMHMIMTLCHRILVLNNGQAIAVDVPSEIQRNEEVIKAYLGEDHELA
jgi:branched-chain amino acid transport system ATP-binding protein